MNVCEYCGEKLIYITVKKNVLVCINRKCGHYGLNTL